MNRGYAVLQIKAVDEAARIIEGIASTPSPDRAGDIVIPTGAKFATPLPLLWQHNHDQPVGHVEFAKASKDGIKFRARIEKIDEAGTLKDRLDEAWQSVKAQLVKGVSIGFKPLKYAFLEEGGIEFSEWEWLELSLVTIPANAEATITAIKSADQKQRAALGIKPAEDDLPRNGKPSGVSGKSVVVKAIPLKTEPKKKDTTMKNVAEQIKDVQATRAAKVAEMQEIMKAAGDEGVTLDAEQEAKYDELEGEVTAIDRHLKRLNSMLEIEKANAKEVHPGAGKASKAASEERGAAAPTIHFKKTPEEKFEGQFYTQMVIAKALAHLAGSGVKASEVAMKRYKDHPMLIEVIKANEVPGGGSGSGEWGAELVTADGRYTGDFIEFLYSKTVFDKLPLRPIPANVTVKGQDGQATGYWVGQSKAIPATTVDFMNVNLTPLKVAALAVVSNELLRDSSPAAEQLVRDALVEASAQRIDSTFLSANAASAGVSPAGILNGLSAISSSGNTGADVRADIKALYAAFLTAKNATDLALIMSPALAKSVSLMVNDLGQTEFPGLNANGGTLLGDNVFTGDNVGAGDVILLKPSDIYKIGDRGVEVSISKEATIEQSTAPTGASDTPVAASQYMTNMFQEESTAIKVVRPINFAKRRSSAVQYIDDAAWGDVGSA